MRTAGRYHAVALFWLQDWHRAFQLWFVLSVAIFMIDSLAEKRWRDPATTALAQLLLGQDGWAENADQLHKAVIAQMACTALILLVMLLHSQLRINLWALSLWPWIS